MYVIGEYNESTRSAERLATDEVFGSLFGALVVKNALESEAETEGGSEVFRIFELKPVEGQ